MLGLTSYIAQCSSATPSLRRARAQTAHHEPFPVRAPVPITSSTVAFTDLAVIK